MHTITLEDGQWVVTLPAVTKYLTEATQGGMGLSGVTVQENSPMCHAFRTAEAYSRGSLCIRRQKSDGRWFSVHSPFHSVLDPSPQIGAAHSLELPTDWSCPQMLESFQLTQSRNSLMPGDLSFPVKLMILTITIRKMLNY